MYLFIYLFIYIFFFKKILVSLLYIFLFGCKFEVCTARKPPRRSLRAANKSNGRVSALPCPALFVTTDRQTDRQTPLLVLYIRWAYTKPNTRWLMYSWSTFGVKISHEWTWTHKIHHDSDLKEAITFPLIVYSMPLHKAHIQMAFCPQTSKGESWNCQSWDSCNFGTS